MKLTQNELVYARNGITSKAQHLRAFLPFAIDLLSIKPPIFSNFSPIYAPLKRSRELLVMGNQGVGN